jgi:hypothetical protein
VRAEKLRVKLRAKKSAVDERRSDSMIIVLVSLTKVKKSITTNIRNSGLEPDVLSSVAEVILTCSWTQSV